MSVENLKVIDVVGIDKNDNVILTISDHLEWDNNNEPHCWRKRPLVPAYKVVHLADEQKV